MKHMTLGDLTEAHYTQILDALPDGAYITDVERKIVFWNRAVTVVGSNIAGVFMNLMPAMGALLAIVFLGERPQLFQLVGILLILAGVSLTTRRRRGLAEPSGSGG